MSPAVFWLLPIFVAGLFWVAFAAWRSSGASMRRRLWGVMAGVLTTVVGCILTMMTVALIPFAAFFPLVFFLVALEVVLLWLGFLAMSSLIRAALLALEPSV
jgi:hypothetical protein